MRDVNIDEYDPTNIISTISLNGYLTALAGSKQRGGQEV
jgi:hypothetical protein